MPDFCSLEIVQQLRLMCGKQDSDRFQFDNNLSNNHIRNVFANCESILVAHFNRDLPLYIQTPLFQPMHEAVLVHFLKVADAKIRMQLISGLPYYIAQL